MIFIEISVYNEDENAYNVLRLCTAPQSIQSSLQYDGEQWLPAIAVAPRMALRLPQDGSPSSLDVSLSSLVLRAVRDVATEDYKKYNFDSATFTMWTGAEDGEFSSFTRIVTGLCGEAQINKTSVEIGLATLDAELSGQLFSQRYAGSGNAEGPISLKGTLKPTAIGSPRNVTPILLDYVRQIYQVHEGDGTVTAVREAGLDRPISVTFASYAALRDATLDVGTVGRFKGFFRFANEPSKIVTADVSTGSARLGTIARDILAHLGVNSSRIVKADFDAIDTEFPFDFHDYLTQETDAYDYLRSILAQADCYAFCDSLGRWRAGQNRALKTPELLSEDRSTLPLVQSMDRAAVRVPTWRTVVSGEVNFTPMRSDDLSQALTTVKADIAEARQAAEDASQAAQDAQQDATASLAQLTAIASDNVLTRDEKPRTVAKFEEITEERGNLIDRADNLSIVTEKNALTSAYSALSSYLSSIAFSNFATDANILGTTYRQKFSDYYVARSALLEKIEEELLSAVGENAFVTNLTNEAHIVATDAAGNGGNYSSAGGVFEAFRGATKLTSGLAFDIVSATPWISIHPTTGVYTVSNSGSDTAVATLRVQWNGFERRKTYSLTKSKAGTAGAAGASAPLVALEADRLTIVFNGQGNLSPPTQSAIVSLKSQNVTGSIIWTFSDNLGTSSASLATRITGESTSSTSITVESTMFSTLATRRWVKVSATRAGLTDSVTIVRLDDGQAGATGAVGATGAAGTNGAEGSPNVLPFQANEAISVSSSIFQVQLTDRIELQTMSISPGDWVSISVLLSASNPGDLRSVRVRYFDSANNFLESGDHILYTASTTSTAKTRVWSKHQVPSGAFTVDVGGVNSSYLTTVGGTVTVEKAALQKGDQFHPYVRAIAPPLEIVANQPPVILADGDSDGFLTGIDWPIQIQFSAIRGSVGVPATYTLRSNAGCNASVSGDILTLDFLGGSFGRATVRATDRASDFAEYSVNVTALPKGQDGTSAPGAVATNVNKNQSGSITSTSYSALGSIATFISGGNVKVAYSINYFVSDPTGSGQAQMYLERSIDGGGWTTVAGTTKTGSTANKTAGLPPPEPEPGQNSPGGAGATSASFAVASGSEVRVRLMMRKTSANLSFSGSITGTNV